MTTSIAAVDICNMALDMLTEAPISSIEDDDPVALRFKRNFDQWRDLFLVLHPWNFAMKRLSVARDAISPAHGWRYRYLLPGDCLRLLPLRVGGEFGGDMIGHEIEGAYVLTDAKPPLKIRYIRRNENYGSWSPQAISAFAGLLAVRMALSVTGKKSVRESAEISADQLLLTAKRLDGLQGDVEKPSYQNVISVRG